MTQALLSDKDLLKNSQDAEEQRQRSDKQQQWMRDVQDHLNMVAAVSWQDFKTVGFQRRLWSSRAISNFGRGGAIDVEALLTDNKLIALLWKLRDSALPSSGPDRTTFLDIMY